MSVLHYLQHLFESRAWFVAGVNQFAARQQRRGADLLLGKRLVALENELVDVQNDMDSQAVTSMQGQVLREKIETKKSLEG